ncbi:MULTISPECIES: 4-hydroxy-tetrahydrodipicolinate reductase [Prochlorococcus]|uniref:4-hydroxy-tetrahydrodipicolinate reductase n=1 Tax=Prochlorococcus marinus (strain SARG / CCMP1375 / SS120) TaxID=167539 RepID=DAPB_PROMA|nr:MULTISPECIES: 4-hydroxy-tetrahydrodipicolinate reductase [Prochlorococcus]Q7VC38.1 RecName: Full=4-hydroxy-tetrahydrodipicolinate reductase; Short=HTPA reductase [Prochlorococcus marinus subsp. marinus str. CCMP1375]AAP99948.1 Dihydrodipicolinate reductase [Prochlorococcus marinus subsp. marinus str. CCMP1375]KGG11707.1 Dihydrodipicolinate reductase [Prochlorococcus marinus str. LG]KGG18880.1 Dihydrodipicolinate reductase [Prochlorococcus marinus str. SS2]KGG23582.1 Dihydrodipicolinate redu
MEKIPVLVAGALGKMGSEVIKAIYKSNDCELVAAIDNANEMEGVDIGTALGMDQMDVAVTADLEGSLCVASQSVRNSSGNAVLIDFTHPNVVYEHSRASIAYGVHPVIGTTGLSIVQLEELREFANKASIGAAIIPNFSVGMVLLQQAAAAAASFYDYAELTESHHNQKADAPSGTCIKTAEIIEEIGKSFNKTTIKEQESIKGSRGGLRESGLRLHSVRLPGIVAQQQVLFGSPGETYLLSHNTIDRSAYMPGVLHTIRKVRHLKSLVYGLEKIL